MERWPGVLNRSTTNKRFPFHRPFWQSWLFNGSSHTVTLWGTCAVGCPSHSRQVLPTGKHRDCSGPAQAPRSCARTRAAPVRRRRTTLVRQARGPDARFREPGLCSPDTGLSLGGVLESSGLADCQLFNLGSGRVATEVCGRRHPTAAGSGRWCAGGSVCPPLVRAGPESTAGAPPGKPAGARGGRPRSMSRKHTRPPAHAGRTEGPGPGRQSAAV